MTSPHKIRLGDALDSFSETWAPRVVGDVNDTTIKVAKFDGEFVWHSHEGEDEAFLVLDGTMTIRFRDRSVDMARGDLIVVPRGVEHLPVGTPSCSVLLIEPNTTVNTGAAESARRLDELERIIEE